MKKIKLSLLILLCVSCTKNEYYYNGFKIGACSSISSIKIAVKIKNQIDINSDIDIDLYYGYEKEYLDLLNENSFKPISIALYYTIDNFIVDLDDSFQKDYTKWTKHVLFKEINHNEFYTEKYEFILKNKRYNFNYHENITLSNELFIKQNSINFCISSVWQNIDTSEYYVSNGNGVWVSYKKTNDYFIFS